MANRYERKWTMMENLYVKGSPVLIEAGALLKDNDTSKMIAQLKFRNIGTKRIKALFVGVKTYDVAGKELDEIDEFQYLDLNVRRDDVFGSNTPIVLKEEITRSFACTCKKVLSMMEVNGLVRQMKNGNLFPK